MGRLVVRELALRKLAEAGPALIAKAEQKFNQAEAHLQAGTDRRSRLVKLIADLSDEIDPRAQLHAEIRSAEEDIQRAKGSIEINARQVRTEAAAMGLSDQGINQKLAEQAHTNRTNIANAEAKLTSAQRNLERDEQKLQAAKNELEMIGE